MKDLLVRFTENGVFFEAVCKHNGTNFLKYQFQMHFYSKVDEEVRGEIEMIWN